jgi:hypothetical protein
MNLGFRHKLARIGVSHTTRDHGTRMLSLPLEILHSLQVLSFRSSHAVERMFGPTSLARKNTVLLLCLKM